jgi:hypothetical protein
MAKGNDTISIIDGNQNSPQQNSGMTVLNERPHKTDKPPTFGMRLWYITKTAASRTTSHGIDKVFDSPFFLLQVLWLLAFIVSTGGCAYFLYLSFAEFFNYKVVTTIKVVSETPTLFPTVTYTNKINCNHFFYC